MGRRLTLEEFLRRAKKVHGDRYDYSKSIYVPAKKIRIICRIHGDFLQIPFNHLNSQQGCPLCAILKVGESQKIWIPRREFIKQARKIHDKRYDYSKVPQTLCRTEKVTIICRKHGEFAQPANKHLRGQNCRKCVREEIGHKLCKKQEQFIEDARKKHGDRYDYSKVVYVNNTKKVIIICKVHGEFLQTPMVHLQGNGDGIGCGCPFCHNRSMGERKISDWLKNKEITFIREKGFRGCRYISPLRFDFYLPDRNTCIEYDGKHHFLPSKWYGGEKTLGEVKIRDKIKEKFCSDRGIRLIRISYKSFNTIEHILEGHHI